MRQKTATLQHPMASDRYTRTDREQTEDKSTEEVEQEAEMSVESKQVESEVTEEKESVPQEYADLRNLIFLGRLEDDVEFSGYKFKITTLSNSQQRKIVTKLMQDDLIKRRTDVKLAGLAEAIISVNGVPLEKLYDGPALEDILEKKMAVLENLQGSVVAMLSNAYDALADRAVMGLTTPLDDVKK